MTTRSREVAQAIAIEVFRRLQDAGPAGPARCDALDAYRLAVATNQRRVLAGIIDTRILDEAGLHRLAEELLWSDKVKYDHPLA